MADALVAHDLAACARAALRFGLTLLVLVHGHAPDVVAEIGTAFLLASLGLAAEPRVDHARYVAHWLDLLRGDKRAVFTAAGRTQSAADWLHNVARQPGGAAAAE